jgi:hypothetical protein
VNSEHNKRLISEAIYNFSDHTKIIMKIDSAEERKHMRDLSDVEFVDASFEMSNLLVNRAMNKQHNRG